ncbi:MAG: hypothetical protein ACXVR1_06565 [Solirubrobacteraceae bacterium]
MRFARASGRRGAPAPIEPLLSLVEEVVLLSLGSSRIHRHHVTNAALTYGPGAWS